MPKGKRCIDCRRPGKGICDACANMRRRLTELHTGTPGGKERHDAAYLRLKAARVARYAALAAAGLPLFAGEPREAAA